MCMYTNIKVIPFLLHLASNRMDHVVDKDLFNFIQCKQEKLGTSQVLDAKVCNKGEKESDVWQTFSNALN